MKKRQIKLGDLVRIRDDVEKSYNGTLSSKHGIVVDTAMIHMHRNRLRWQILLSDNTTMWFWDDSLELALKS